MDSVIRHKDKHSLLSDSSKYKSVRQNINGYILRFWPSDGCVDSWIRDLA